MGPGLILVLRDWLSLKYYRVSVRLPSFLTVLAVWELGVLAYSSLVFKMTLVWAAACVSPGEFSSHVGSIGREVALYEPSVRGPGE